jgi:hypothetical protein
VIKNKQFAKKRKNNYDLNSLNFMGLSEQGGEILTIFVNCT